MTPRSRLGEAMRRRLLGLNRLLAIDDGSDRQWRWLIPASVLVGTILAFVVIGRLTSAPVELYLPNGVVIAVVMSGLAVACMSPNTDEADTDDPPGGDDDDPVLGSPGGPWVVVAHLGPAPAGRERDGSEDRELVTTAPA